MGLDRLLMRQPRSVSRWVRAPGRPLRRHHTARRQKLREAKDVSVVKASCGFETFLAAEVARQNERRREIV